MGGAKTTQGLLTQVYSVKPSDRRTPVLQGLQIYCVHEISDDAPSYACRLLTNGYGSALEQFNPLLARGADLISWRRCSADLVELGLTEPSIKSHRLEALAPSWGL